MIIVKKEIELIENIKYKNRDELTLYFNNNVIKAIDYNNFERVLCYLITNQCKKKNVIKFIIEKQPVKVNNNMTLFHSVEYNRYEIARLLLKKGK